MMRLKRIGNTGDDLYQGQDGKVYKGDGTLVHDRELPPSEVVEEPEVVEECEST